MSKTKQAHLDYWRARSEAIFRYVDQTDLDVLAELSKIYAEQAVVMQKELYQFVMSYAENSQMSYQEALERLRKVDLSDYQANAKRYFEQAKNAKDPELLKRLNEQYVAARASRMDLLHLEMTYRLGSLNQVLQGTFESYLKKTAKYAYRKAMAGSASLDESLLKTLVEAPFDGRNYSKQLWDNTDKLAKDLKDVLKRGFIRGDSVKTMAQEIAGKYNIARSRAQTLIRTDGTAIINRSAIQRYKDAGLTYYRDSVHLDDRTTAICREVARKNELKRIDEMVIGVNAAPYHYNCRTAVIPEVEEEGTFDEYDSKSMFSDVENIWEKVSNGKLSKAEIVTKLKERYYLGDLPRNISVLVSSKVVYIDNSSLASSLERHGTQYKLEEFKLIEEIVKNPYLVLDNSDRVAGSFLLYAKIPGKDKVMMEAVVVPNNGMLMIHFNKVGIRQEKKNRKSKKILYEK